MATILSALSLIVLSLFLMYQHWQAWNSIRTEQINLDEREFAWSQFRRRMQTSAMLGLVGVAIFASPLVRDPLFFLFYWGGIILLVFWIVLLAFADFIHTRAYYNRLRNRQLSQQAALTTELADFSDKHKLNDSEPESPNGLGPLE